MNDESTPAACGRARVGHSVNAAERRVSVVARPTRSPDSVASARFADSRPAKEYSGF
jgi:hypothetical protein